MTTKKLKPSRSKSSQFKTTTGDEKRVKTDVVKRTVNKPSATAPGSKKLLPGSALTNTGIFLLLVIGTAALYSGDLHLDFFRIDDKQYVVNNPWITSFTAENIGYILSTPYFTNYSPLHLFSYMLDYSFNGADPYIFHLSSNIWAGMVAGMVFLTALALTGRHLIAIAAAVLFVVHPAHVEAIAWISSRKDLVATAFALPSLLAYLYYRNGGRYACLWYMVSVGLFIFALAGKLSVATFPAIFLALDLFKDKRPFLKSLPDKIPYLVVAAIMAAIVAKAQPPTGAHPDPFVLLSALVQNFWLLTGFGTHVIYRVAPLPQNLLLELVASLVLIMVFVAPILLRRRFPLTTVLVYWILFAFIPTQVLSFTYPVTDRYLFFPSVAAVIIIASAVMAAGESFIKRSYLLALGLLTLIAGYWTYSTVSYLNEWKDPRSVWYAASKKSEDPQVYYNLGWSYMDKAARFGSNPRKAALSKEEAREFASLVWKENANLQALISEWNNNQHGGPTEKTFLSYLRKLSHEAYDRALALKANHIMPEFFFHRGMLYLDEGNFMEARNNFMKGLEEASHSSFVEGNQEVTVNCHYNLGILSWAEGKYPEALQWLTLVEEEQNRFGNNWFPDVSTHRQRLEQFIKTLPAQKAVQQNK